MKRLLGLMFCFGLCLVLGFGSTGCSKKPAEKKADTKAGVGAKKEEPKKAMEPKKAEPKKEEPKKEEPKKEEPKKEEPKKAEPKKEEPKKEEPKKAEPKKEEPKKEEPKKEEPKKSDTKKKEDKKASTDIRQDFFAWTTSPNRFLILPSQQSKWVAILPRNNRFLG